MTEKFYLVLDIGGTKIAGGISDGKQIFHQMQTPTLAHEGAEAVMGRVIAMCEMLVGKALATGQAIQAAGVGSAGLVDAATGRAMDAIENLPGWQQMPVAERLNAVLDKPVYVDNDVNIMALGESLNGVGAQYSHVFYVAAGTGIGGALIVDGRISHGAHYSRGEVGYLVARIEDGRVQTMEELAGGPAMTAQYRALSGDENIESLRDVVARAEAGDDLARKVIQDGATLTGEVIGRFLGALDTEALIVSGGVASIGELWWQPFTAALARNPLKSIRELPVHHVVAGVEAALLGAAALAMQRSE